MVRKDESIEKKKKFFIFLKTIMFQKMKIQNNI